MVETPVRLPLSSESQTSDSETSEFNNPKNNDSLDGEPLLNQFDVLLGTCRIKIMKVEMMDLRTSEKDIIGD